MQEIREQLKNAIKDLYGLADFDPELTPSPANIDADYSSNAPLKLAKELHKPPMEIAEELVEALKNSAFEEHICRRGKYGATEARDRQPEEAREERTSSFFRGDDGRTTSIDGPEGAFRKSTILSATNPGFINFTLNDEYLTRKINDIFNDFDQTIALDDYKNQTIICEFSDPNPFKVLHVGHLYTSIVGDAISRLYESAGAHVIRANFGGDVGLHVAKTMYALRKKPIENLTIEDIAKCYIEGTAAYEENETAKQEIIKLNKEIYQINAAGEPKKVLSRERSEKESFSVPMLTELYWRGRELSYDYFRDFYATIGVKFDKFYPESTVAELGLTKVKEQLETGVYEYSNGAVIFDGEKYGLHTRVFINQDGIPTYETKDVGLIFTKWDDYHFDKSIVITGSEQLEYMKVVLKSVEQYAPELTSRTTHLTHGLVKLPGNVKMSSRKGNFLKAVDVLDMVKTALEDEYNSTDEIVSLSATKYAFLKYKMGGQIIFDPHESVKMTGNSGPYLLYSCVRAKKILASVDDAFEEHICRRGKYGATEARDRQPEEAREERTSSFFRGDDGRTTSIDGPEGAFRESIIKDASERNLFKKIIEYKDILKESVAEMAPHKLANYLYELAQTFSRFYEHCPVHGSDRESDRLKLVQVYLDTMTHGLGILGINTPEEM